VPHVPLGHFGGARRLGPYAHDMSRDQCGSGDRLMSATIPVGDRPQPTCHALNSVKFSSGLDLEDWGLVLK